MKALRKVFDKALWFFGAQPRRAPGRSGKDNRTFTASGTEKPWSASVSASTFSSSSDLRSELELERYLKLLVSFDTQVQADRGWLRCLRRLDVWQSMRKPGESDLAMAEQSSHQLASRLYDLVSHLAAEFNDLSHQIISMTPPAEVNERRKVSKQPGAVEITESIVYMRWRAATASWALSCRAREGLVEIFLVPASDLMALSQAEAPLRLKLRLELMSVGDKLLWTCDGLPVSSEDLRVLMRMFFRDLVSSTQDHQQPVQTSLGDVDDKKLARSIEQLLIERENLAQKVVIQQEEIQKRIARDLHDAVISDVMALKRSLSAPQAPNAAELLSSLEGIVRKLREICYDLSPRDLSDWGLATVVEDMLDQMSQRTGIDCELLCDIELPVMPSAVLLHIYRIIQESLNNAEKYAEPSRVVVTFEMVKNQFVVTVADNGKGFELESGAEKSGRSGGYGMGSLRERADLIRCFYPTKFYISSMPGKGSRVKLEIDLARFH